ncbi:hypothetical protein G4B11_000253 [Aspergillus flavus]|nr:hypothetical protein G4B11_000253 [Aspergillus flavus]
MSLEQTLYSNTPVGTVDPTCAGPAAFSVAGVFSQTDFMAFSTQEEQLWGFNTIPLPMAPWQGSLGQQTFRDPDQEWGLQNTHVRGRQSTPPPLNEKKLQPTMGEVCRMRQYDFNSSLPEPFDPKQCSSLSNQFQTHGYAASTRHRKASAALLNEQQQQQERKKREKFLERRRLAVRKCRQMKKEHATLLKTRFLEVSVRKSELKTEIEHLRSEILDLKNELLRHTECWDESIKLHLVQRVRMITPKNTPDRDLVTLMQSPGQHATPTAQALCFGFDSPQATALRMESPLDHRNDAGFYSFNT